jgi:hypothetical protein
VNIGYTPYTRQPQQLSEECCLTLAVALKMLNVLQLTDSHVVTFCVVFFYLFKVNFMYRTKFAVFFLYLQVSCSRCLNAPLPVSYLSITLLSFRLRVAFEAFNISDKNK